MKWTDDLNKKLAKHKFLRLTLINLRNYGILFIMLIVYFVIGAMVSTSNTGLPAASSTGLYSAFVAILSYIWYLGLKKDHKVKELDVKVSKKRYMFYFGEVVLLSVGILFAFSFIDIFISDSSMEARREYASKITDLGLYYLVSCTIVPMSEECMLRLFLYNVLNTGSHWVISMSVSSVIFALLHGTISHAILATFFGLMMCLLYHNTGKWWISIIAHVIYNVLAAFAGDFIQSLASNPVIAIAAFSVSVVIIVFEIEQGLKIDRTVAARKD